MTALTSGSHAAKMDRIYGLQRHFYDVTRKYYLLGRDRLIRCLDVRPGQTVLEVGCGTGRNLALVARQYPGVRLYGLDISFEMLKSAKATLGRAGLGATAQLAQADATSFDAGALFGEATFDRIFLSYTVSMIPDWQRVIEASLGALGQVGELHIVDFGGQTGLPRWFGRALCLWLARFHVAPRAGLIDYCASAAKDRGFACTVQRLYSDYAWSIVLAR